MDKTKALQRLLDGTASDEEINLLKHALASGDISIGGDVNRSVVIIGNGNKVELTSEALSILKPKIADEKIEAESHSQSQIFIRLNQQFCIEDSDSELVSYEIARILNSGATPEFIFYSPGYSDEKLELSQPTDIPSHRRLELLRAVEEPLCVTIDETKTA